MYRKLISIPIFFCFGLVASLMLGREQTNGKWAEDWFWYQKAHQQKTYDVVFFGDSRTARGIDPSAFGGDDASVYNFGFRSANLSSAILLRASKLVKPNGKLVLGIAPGMFVEDGTANKHYRQYQKKSRQESWSIAIKAKWLYGLEPINIRKKMKERLNKPMEQLDFRDNGWMASATNKADTFAYKSQYLRFYEDHQVSQKRIQECLVQMAKLKQSGIEVYGFFPPVASYMDSLDFGESGFDSTAFKQSFRAHGGTWLRVPRKSFQTYDGSHLDSLEAKRFSVYLGKELTLESSHK